MKKFIPPNAPPVLEKTPDTIVCATPPDDTCTRFLDHAQQGPAGDPAPH